MTDDQIAQLLYLVLLGSAIGGIYVMQGRERLGQMARAGAIWILIFLGVIAGIGLWNDIRDTVRPRQAVFSEQGRIEVPRGPDGHYYLTARINGAPIRFVVDTGATDIVLSRDDAARAGIAEDSLEYFGTAMTANGRVRTARVTLERVAVGGISDSGVTAYVNEGRMDISLLGMAYLSRFDRIEIADSRLILIR
ncbi:MAG: TIGR02281 family clan AA aspartic protease [Pseudomonadota bacterium]